MLTCLTPTACPKAAKAYYASSPILKHNLGAYKRNVEAEIGSQTLVGLTVAASLLGHHTYQIRMGHNLNLQLQTNGDKLIVYNLEF